MSRSLRSIYYLCILQPVIVCWCYHHYSPKYLIKCRLEYPSYTYGGLNVNLQMIGRRRLVDGRSEGLLVFGEIQYVSGICYASSRVELF